MAFLHYIGNESKQSIPVRSHYLRFNLLTITAQTTLKIYGYDIYSDDSLMVNPRLEELIHARDQAADEYNRDEVFLDCMNECGTVNRLQME